MKLFFPHKTVRENQNKEYGVTFSTSTKEVLYGKWRCVAINIHLNHKIIHLGIDF